MILLTRCDQVEPAAIAELRDWLAKGELAGLELERSRSAVPTTTT